jgi:hypothetical protein
VTGIVVGAVAAAAVVVLGTVGPLAPDAPARDGAVVAPGGASSVPGASEAGVGGVDPVAEPPTGSPASIAPTATAASGLGESVVVTFDLHPVGPIEPEELELLRQSGALEVVPFPSAFDRSLRFSGPEGALCLPAPSSGDGWTIGLDLEIGESVSDGRLHLGLGPGEDGAGIGLALDLAALAHLQRETWYTLSVSPEGDGPQVEIRPRGGGPALGLAEITFDDGETPVRGEACVGFELAGPDGSVHVDNLRVAR